MKNNFFKPKISHKEFVILDSIERDQHIKQRQINKTIDVDVSMIISYFDSYEKNGLNEKILQ